MEQASLDLSVVIPVYNEEEGLPPLVESLAVVLDQLDCSYEIVLCDDGSQDGTRELVREWASQDPRIKGVLLRRNFGQTAAITAGVDHAVGDIVVLMDADGQNDPKDIPSLLETLNEGYDIVSGWRRKRNDPFLTKVLPSKFANWIIACATGLKLHDHGCTLKAYRRSILNELSLYGEMHRFISIYGHWVGAKVGEVEVNHHPRQFGRSKYSIAKTFKVILDLPVLILLGSYLTRPMHLFGGAGLVSIIMGLFCWLLVIYDKLQDVVNNKVHRNPLFMVGILLGLVGIQMLMLGLLAELLTRVYHESQRKKTYAVEESLNVVSPTF